MNKCKTTVGLAVCMFFLVVFNSFARSQISQVIQRGNETVITFQLSEYEIKSEVINGEECNYIKVPEICNVHEKGYPQLPWFTQSIIIPNNAAMGLEIVDVQFKELQVKKIASSKGTIYRDQNPAEIPYAFGEIYSKDVWYPETAAGLGTPYIMRDVRGIVVRFQPFQYNAVKGILRVAESITVKVNETGPGKINVLTKKFNAISPTFDKVYQSRFLNYSQVRSRYTPVEDGDKMIVIAASDFMSDMEPFVAWKNQKGIKTDLYDYPDETGSGSSSIENFIQGKYDDEGIAYVLLVGDAGDVPSLSGSSGPSDPDYTLVDGSDNNPDIFIGRFSGSTSSYITKQANKVLNYEKEPDPSGEWYHKAMGIASAEGNPSDKEWMEDMREVLMAYNYTEVDQIYDPGASASDVSSGLNDGRTWCNYMGHGSKTRLGTTGFGNSNANSLNNEDMLPVVVMVACYPGDFDGSGDCLAEAFVKADGGAIVAMAASNSQSWNPPQIAQREMVKVLCEDLYISVGGILYNGEMKMLESGNASTFQHWNVFGDPSLVVFTDTPDELSITPPQNVPQGPSKVTVSFGKAEIDGRVCFWDATNGIAGSAMVAGQSSVEVDVDAPNVDKLTLTVTGRNVVPYIAEVPVGPQSITQTDLLKNMKMQCFPNPFTATANITFANPLKNALVTIYSSDGKVVLSENVSGNNFKWNAKEQTSGLYFVKVRANDKVFEKRICLMK